MTAPSPEQELRGQYISWTMASLGEMRGHFVTLANEQGPAMRETLEAIYAIAHNIKGMGSSFDFPLMTEAGTSLCKYLRSLGDRPVNLEVIDAHIRSFEVVMNNDIEGAGGDMGAALISRLEMLVDRSLAA